MLPAAKPQWARAGAVSVGPPVCQREHKLFA
jgi:hypothetical protein